MNLQHFAFDQNVVGVGFQITSNQAEGGILGRKPGQKARAQTLWTARHPAALRARKRSKCNQYRALGLSLRQLPRFLIFPLLFDGGELQFLFFTFGFLTLAFCLLALSFKLGAVLLLLNYH